MDSVVLVIHLFLALAIIGLVLIQRSEGGGLGIGGGGLGGLASQRGTANILTRATAICAGAFFCTSLILAVMAGRNSTAGTSILDEAAPAAIEQPAEAPAAEAPETKQPEGGGSPPAAPIAR